VSGRLAAVAVGFSRRSRATKLRTILALLPPGATILAVGVEGDGGTAGGGFDTGNQVELGLQAAGYVLTALAYGEEIPGSLVAGGAAILRGDGRCLPFRDRAFDLVMSNAVVEHVGGRDDAARFVEESRRVARFAAIHTTPNRWFPIETHTKLPFVQWLPRAWHSRLLRLARRYRRRDGDCLFSTRDLTQLSPGGNARGAWPRGWPATIVGTWPCDRSG
jgi:hypothetical protein